MRKTKRNRTPKKDRKNDFIVVDERGHDICINKEFTKDNKPVNIGCKNQRAHGSSRCVECTYTYHLSRTK
jgi:hypothetical protein